MIVVILDYSVAFVGTDTFSCLVCREERLLTTPSPTDSLQPT
jgi:hypothetical protein